ncbi:MAG: hypothetical protein Q4Q62_05365 [Thermoplasmata archaeon]|nr:hypothetical protein [Thermoplasmata archaeon]
MSDLNLYQRRINARRQVSEVSFKKVDGKDLKYAYLPVDQMKPVVERAWIENGIVMDILDCTFDAVTPSRQVPTQYEGKSVWWVHQSLRMTLRLVNADDPADTAMIVIYGEAKDNSDKVINKCFTSALKNFYKVEFNIVESKDDTDALQDDEAIIASNDPTHRNSMAESAKNDPFFGKKEEPRNESQADAKSDFETLARSEEQTRNLVEKWGHLDTEAEGILGTYKFQYGDNTEQWGPETLGECYNALLEHCKQRNKGASA